MTKTITISVPDELHEKMVKWKESFNFSRVFQEAISYKIQRKEDFQKRLKEETKDMDETIRRLRKEKEESEKGSFNAGKNSGLSWAVNAHYNSIKLVVDRSESDFSQTRIELSYFDEEPEELPKVVDIEDPNWNSHALGESWEKGWVEGVCEFWDTIKDKL